eukprot:gb/GECH01010530.1/.p1 GENE.gb/GECH01010530.1/~~gb/GECH01010530.1/.p1  ORF type:complete len:1383 (+),score=295.26 gb/GECH01010530.1/:1-4149(+)
MKNNTKKHFINILQSDSEEDLHNWMKSQDLAELIPKFQEHQITSGVILSYVRDQDFNTLVPHKIGLRIKLQRALDEIRDDPSTSDSQQEEKDDSSTTNQKPKALFKNSSHKEQWLRNAVNRILRSTLNGLASQTEKIKDILSDTHMTMETMSNVLNLFYHVIHHPNHMEHLKKRILSQLCTCRFISHPSNLQNFLQQIIFFDYDYSYAQVLNFFQWTLEIMSALSRYFPAYRKNLPLEGILNLFKIAYDRSLIPIQLLISFSTVYTSCCGVGMKQTILPLSENNFENRNDSKFRSIETKPSLDELKESTPHLEPNRIQQPYDDLEHYLSTHFHLIRQDFIIPLRSGLHSSMKAERSKDASYNQKRTRNLFFYSNVELVGFGGQNGVVYSVACPTFNKIQWENSKKLIFGSLVVLSSDGFNENVIWAIGKQRDVDFNKNRVLNLSILEGELEFNTKYQMLQSPAYFEAYRHVLDVLKHTIQIPFKSHLIDVNQHVEYPDYLPQKLSVKRTFNNINRNRSKSSPSKSINRSKKWPEIMDKLDQTQIKAIKHAFNKKLALIQGPPGTGKTFVGLKIAELLLENAPISYFPILVICFTNHALDQFLDGILDFENSVVRIGGRSRSEKIQQYNLKEKAKKLKLKVNGSMFQSRDELDIQLKYFHKIVQFQWIPFCFLKQMITQKTLNKFLDANFRYIDASRLLIDWKNGKDHLMRTVLKHPEPNAVDISNDFQWLSSENNNEELEPRNHNDDLFQKYDDYNKRQGRFQDHGIKNQGEKEQNSEEEEEKDGDLDGWMRFGKQNYHENGQENSEEETDSDEKSNNQLDAEEIHEIEEERGLDRSSPQHSIFEFPKILNLPNLSNGKNFLFQEEDFKPTNDPLDFDPWTLKLEQREKLFDEWFAIVRKACLRKIRKISKEYETLEEEISEAHAEIDLEVLRKSKVIGVTTTGAAKYRNIISNLYPNPKIAIVEEAAEVLEAHIVTSLKETTEHLILIGDHRQLRPSTEEFDIAYRLKLEVSLFERLVKCGFQHVTLREQRRMRPKIAELMNFVYNGIQNNDSVQQYPRMKGIGKDMFFIDHQVPEDSSDQGTSKFNMHEVSYISNLCSCLIHQGYSTDQITVLTPYYGQMFALRKEIRKISEEIHVLTVDRFQGRESDIVLLSLVRSNDKRSIGFLKFSNRIIVSLSRARMGFYIIGNSSCFSHNSLWEKIFNYLQVNQMFDSQLPIYCQNHPDYKVAIQTPQDFDNKAPNGGCLRKCEARLTCGHLCPLYCHGIPHSRVNCMREVEKTFQTCLHKWRGKCYVWEQNKAKCDKRYRIEHPCGHQNNLKCHQLCIQCKDNMSRVLSGSVDEFTIDHFQEIDGTIRCFTSCSENLNNGNKCRRSYCYKCSVR